MVVSPNAHRRRLVADVPSAAGRGGGAAGGGVTADGVERRVRGGASRVRSRSDVQDTSEIRPVAGARRGPGWAAEPESVAEPESGRRAGVGASETWRRSGR